VANPPFNTIDFYGADAISATVTDYNQVGGYFFQTDGPTLPRGSTMEDVFLHVNDDAIKSYHSGLTVDRAIIWKGHNDPVIQVGWCARDVHDVRINHMHVIHTRYRKDEMVVPSSILGASPFYDSSSQTVDSNMGVHLVLSNIVCEGPSPALMRITPLQNFNVRLENVSFPDGHQSIAQESRVLHAPVKMELHISNLTIGGKPVDMNNFQHDGHGRLNIDASFWGQWSVC